MGRIGRYFCPACNTVNVVSGNCFKCGAPLKEQAPEAAGADGSEYEQEHEPHGYHGQHDTRARLRSLQKPGLLTKRQVILLGALALLGLSVFMMLGGGQPPPAPQPAQPPSVPGPKDAKVAADKAIAIAVRYAGFKDTPPIEWAFEDTSERTGAVPSFGMKGERGNQNVLFIVWDNTGVVDNLGVLLSKLPFADYEPPPNLGEARVDSGEAVVGNGPFKWFVGRYRSTKDHKLHQVLVGAYRSPIAGKAIVVISPPTAAAPPPEAPPAEGNEPPVPVDYKTVLWLVDTMAAQYTAAAASDKGAPGDLQKATEEAGEKAEEKPLASDSELDAYRKRVEAIIKGKFKPPKEKVEDRVAVLVGLTEDGRVKKLEITRPSGTDSFDQSVLRAITDSEPYPPAPHTRDALVSFTVTADGAKLTVEEQ